MKRTILVASLLLGALSYGEAAIDRMVATPLKTKDTKVKSFVTLYPAPEPGVEFTLAGADQEIAASAIAVPVNLFVLFDNSKSCQKSGFDKSIPRLLKKIRASLPAESLATIASYSRDAVEVHAPNKPIDDLAVDDIKCSGQTSAGTLERPLNYLLDKSVRSDLPVYVWVYSSGAVDISAPLASRLRKAGVVTHIQVYQSALAKTASNAVARLAKSSGLSISAGALTSALPSQAYRVSAELPYDLTGKPLHFRIKAEVGKSSVQSRSFPVLTPKKEPGLFDKAPQILLLVALMAVLFAVFRIIQRYRGLHCSQCRRRLRYEDKQCAFCEAKERVYLVGRFNSELPARFQKIDLMPIRKRVFSIGNRRRSDLRLLAPKSARGRKFARIQMDRTQDSVCYRIAPIWAGERFPLEVNGQPLQSPRYLSHGDRIRVGETELTFVVGGMA